MSVEGILARGRAAALKLMRDTCIIERRTGKVWDDDTGDYTPTWTTVYSGKCRIKTSGGGRDSEIGQAEVTLHRYPVVLPWDTSAAVEREDRLTVTASDDTWVVDRRMEVVDVSYSGTSTARHLLVEDRS